jgi:carbon storage regulator
MLVISRNQDESFTIGDNIKIVIIKTGRGFVKIGIDAPREVRVKRDDMRIDPYLLNNPILATMEMKQ